MASQFPEYPKVKVEYHIVTPLSRTAMIYTDLARAEEHQLYPGWRLIKVTTTQYDITPLSHDEIDHNIDHCWSLESYINWLNKDQEFPIVCEDRQYWYNMGIHTARELANYLDESVEKELTDPAKLENV